MSNVFGSLLIPYYGYSDELSVIDFASGIARDMGAEVSLLYLARILAGLPEEEIAGYQSKYAEGGSNDAMAYLDGLHQGQLKKDADRVRVAAADRFRQNDIPSIADGAAAAIKTCGHRWEQDTALSTDIHQLLIHRAITFDAVIASTASMRAIGQRVMAVALMNESGRPVIVVPAGWSSAGHSPRRILVAWKKTVHTIRAITSAIPLLRASQNNLVLEIDEGGTPSDETVTAKEISHWLSRHGIASDTLRVEAKGRKPEDLLDQEIEMFQADTMVMGAYSRSRMREVLFGGLTQHVLNNVKIPTLLAH